MVRRHGNGQFASALVFPGGLVDPSDREDDWLPLLHGSEGLDTKERTLTIAACRETFEESALLLARDGEGGSVSCTNEDRSDFRAVVAASGGRLMFDDLALFGHWIIPVGPPKRFDTHFFLAAAPRGQDAVADGSETVALEWVQPRHLLARAKDGDLSILFRTRLNLKRLAESDSESDSVASRRRWSQLDCANAPRLLRASKSGMAGPPSLSRQRPDMAKPRIFIRIHPVHPKSPNPPSAA